MNAGKNKGKAELHHPVTIEEIRKAGRKAGLSYMQSLSLYLFEQILCWVSQSSLKEKLWLKGVELNLQGKRKKTAPNRIIFYMKDICWQSLNQFMAHVVEEEKENGFQMSYELLFFDEQLDLHLKLLMEQAAIPFSMIVRPVWQQEQFGEDGKYSLFFQENYEIIYKSYPKELNLAECFYEIMERLELIGSMEAYETACQLLHTYPVDGRRFYLDMKVLLEKKPMASEEKRWETVLGYRDYTYMEKRWMKFQKSKETSWEELMTLLDGFFTPVWEAIQGDRIFFGDWMPHLGRYLD